MKKTTSIRSKKIHRLQWKFIGIMFVSLFSGVTFLGISQALVSLYFGGITAEEAEIKTKNVMPIFDVLFIIVTIIVFILLSRRIFKRIENMTKNVEKIATGNMEELIVDMNHDELGILAQHINEMAETIKSSLDKERSMVCSVAHDLRTPVTSIQGYTQLLEQSDELSEKNKEYVTIIKNKSIDLSEQINELLEYSILQFQEKVYEFQPLSLSSLVEQVLIEFIPQLEKEKMQFSLTGNKKDYVINCNSILMVRLLENLITNGIRYGRQGGKLELAFNEKEERVQLLISNYGSYMSREEQVHIFDAFYQGEDTKNYKSESKGLGLAIASQIIQIHNGTIWAESDEKTCKTTFGFELNIFRN